MKRRWHFAHGVSAHMTHGAASARTEASAVCHSSVRHPGGVAAERGLTNAAEALLSGLAAEAPAERFGVAVGDPGLGESPLESAAVVLRIAARSGVATDVDERLNSRPLEHLQEHRRRPGSVPD